MMRLLTKTSLVYFLAAMIVFAVGGWIFFFNLRNILDEEVNEKLEVKKERMEAFIEKYDSLPSLPYDADPADLISETKSKINERFADTVFYSAEEGEELPYRTLEFTENIGDHTYLFRISKPMIENDDLEETILYSFAIITSILAAVLLVVNLIVSRILLRPFSKMLEQLKSFKLDGSGSLISSRTSTKEFRQLNEALVLMTNKVREDYNNVKSFTENASHELQTPLAVILAETEQLLQSSSLSEEQLNTIQSVNQTARRLSRLNESLLLLSKISNQQYRATGRTDLSLSVKRKLRQLEELIHFKAIFLEEKVSENVMWELHPVLCDILVNNLVSNAVRHTENGGKLNVVLTENEFSVSNSGSPFLHPEKIVERFYKESTSSESTGLGLAIVKQICESSGLKLSYRYENGLHVFCIQD